MEHYFDVNPGNLHSTSDPIWPEKTSEKTISALLLANLG